MTKDRDRTPAGGLPGWGPAAFDNAGGIPAGAMIRLAARVIDTLLIFIVFALIGLIVRATVEHIDNRFITATLAAAVTLAYYVSFEVTRGRTPGKQVLGLHVRGARNKPKPSVRESLLRNSFLVLGVLAGVPIVGSYPLFVAVIAIGITISNNPTRQGVHDRLADGTQVVKL